LIKALITQNHFFHSCENVMCEFNVILNGKVQFKDVIYAKIEGDNVIVKNILGEAKEFKNCKIVEVDVNSTRLVLSSLKP
jgi:predicted RNA-binding protein